MCPPSPPSYYQSAIGPMVTHALGYYAHLTSLGNEHSVCYELLLTSFIYILPFFLLFCTNVNDPSPTFDSVALCIAPCSGFYIDQHGVFKFYH